MATPNPSVNAKASYPLLTFDGATDRSPAVAAWFDRKPSELTAIARDWFSRFRESGPEVRELLHDGCPVVCVQDAPFGYVDAFAAHVNIGFFHGASLPDPSNILVGTGKFMRHVKLRPGVPYDSAALQALVAAAYQDICARLARPASAGSSA